MRTVLLFLFMLCLLCSCGGGDTTTTAAVSHVDSAAQAAPDTLRASMDTSSRKDQACGSGGDKASPDQRH